MIDKLPGPKPEFPHQKNLKNFRGIFSTGTKSGVFRYRLNNERNSVHFDTFFYTF